MCVHAPQAGGRPCRERRPTRSNVEGLLRILIASVSNREPEVFLPHLASVGDLDVPPDVEVEYAYISDGLHPRCLQALEILGARVADASPKSGAEVYGVTEKTHAWNEASFDWLAAEKQRLLDLAVEEGFDAIMLVDSDLIIGPETLSSLLTCRKEVVSAVFWTRWSPELPEMPQVWLTHPYGLEGRSGLRLMKGMEFVRRLRRRELLEVGGLGACTLIRTSALKKGVRFFPRLEGLPLDGMWQGEDRTFSILANQLHVPLWADAWPDILHLYRPSDVKTLRDGGWKPPTRVAQASFGDEVSFVLEPLEDAEIVQLNLSRHVRGRIGRLPILLEIEAALLTTPVGEEKIVKVKFPEDWEAGPFTPKLAGKTRAVMLRVLDAKAR